MALQQKLCALSVDLDPLTAYYQIHGLGDPPRHLRATIMGRVLPRFFELFSEAGVPSTLFIVGRELERDGAPRELLARMVTAGHELANHTFSHPYDLCRLPEQVIDQEIRRAHEAIVATVGAFLIAIAICTWLVNIAVSYRRREPAGDDPWGGQTLEWATSSPPPRHNFTSLPPIRSYAPLLDLTEEERRR